MATMLKLIGDNIGLIGLVLFIILLLIGFFGFVIFLSYSKKLNQYFIDDSGKLSMGRLVIFLSIFFYVVSAAYNLISKGSFPDIPMTLAALMGTLYGVNKLSPTLPFHDHDHDDNHDHHDDH